MACPAGKYISDRRNRKRPLCEPPREGGRVLEPRSTYSWLASKCQKLALNCFPSDGTASWWHALLESTSASEEIGKGPKAPEKPSHQVHIQR